MKAEEAEKEQARLTVCASACRACIVNFHAALHAAPLRMKARWLRACGSLRCRSGRCLTSGLRSTSVVAGRVVYTPFRSLLDKRHWRLATQARSTPRSYRLVGKCPRIRTSELARMCVRLPSFHSKRTCRLAAASL